MFSSSHYGTVRVLWINRHVGRSFQTVGQVAVKLLVPTTTTIVTTTTTTTTTETYICSWGRTWVDVRRRNYTARARRDGCHESKSLGTASECARETCMPAAASALANNYKHICKAPDSFHFNINELKVLVGRYWLLKAQSKLDKLETKMRTSDNYLLQWRYRDTNIKQLSIAKNSSVLNYLVFLLLVFWINIAIMAPTVS